MYCTAEDVILITGTTTASDIIAAFARVLKKENVDIRLKQRAVQILTKSGRFAGVKLAVDI